MSTKPRKAVKNDKVTAKPEGKRTPEALRQSLREHDIHTTAESQLQALGAIYRVGTHEDEVDLRILLSAIGRVQNLHSLALRASALANKKGFGGQFFLNK